MYVLQLLRRKPSTADITALPDATLTPGERAWDAYRSIKNNPRCWNQNTFGEVQDGRVVGCFAHHLVRRAGYETVAPFAGARARDRVRTRDLAQADNWRLTWLANEYTYIGNAPVEAVAAGLLGLAVHATAEMFSGGNSLTRLHMLLEERYGPEPVHR